MSRASGTRCDAQLRNLFMASAWSFNARTSASSRCCLPQRPYTVGDKHCIHLSMCVSRKVTAFRVILGMGFAASLEHKHCDQKLSQLNSIVRFCVLIDEAKQKADLLTDMPSFSMSVSSSPNGCQYLWYIPIIISVLSPVAACMARCTFWSMTQRLSCSIEANPHC